jgi:hypothetical protein
MGRTLEEWKRILPKEYHAEIERQYSERAGRNGNNPAVSTPNVEQDTRAKLLATKKKDARFSTPICISVHSVRSRLADSDGVSIKAALDGLVKAGILYDDGPKYVRSSTQSQEKGENERTVITIKRA